MSLQPFFVQALAGNHGLNYNISLLPTTGRKFDFALCTSRTTCASEPKLAPQAVCVWIRKEHVHSVENRSAQHVVQLCTRQLDCMQNSTAHSTLTNMSLPSASSLESPQPGCAFFHITVTWANEVVETTAGLVFATSRDDNSSLQQRTQRRHPSISSARLSCLLTLAVVLVLGC